MVFNRSSIAAAFTASVLLALGGSAAQAQTPLGLGQSTGGPNSNPVIGFLGGTQVGGATTTFGDAQNGQSINGTLLSAVFQGGNAQDATFLDFYYQFTNSAASNQAVQSISIASFLGADTAVGQTTADVDGGGPFAAGGSASSSAQRSGNGAGLVFDYGTGVNQGAFSTTMVIRTNAISFSQTGSAAFFGAAGISANSNGLVIAAGSVSAAPEPGSLALLGMGALGMVGAVARRRRAK